MIPPEADPVAFVRTALDALPIDPSAATQADLELLAAANEGLTRLTASIYADVAALTCRLLDGALITDLVDEHTRLEALCANAELAHHRLVTYSAAATEANGTTFDQLIAGD
jgi:hypothetical protein